ncbi:hypothetical protein A2U01_0079464, partial [Trifolium medium]|nr:hypothetical protein [Trifolium medium]
MRTTKATGTTGMTDAEGEDGTQKTPLPMNTGVAVTTTMRTDMEEGEAVTLEKLHSPPGFWNP